MSTIIFLNGPSSAGKSTIAHTIQSISSGPLVYFSMDAFFEMLPKKYVLFGEKANEGYVKASRVEDSNSTNMLKTDNGPLANQFFNNLPSIAQILANAGNNLIIDELLVSNDYLKAYLNALKQHTVYFIGVFCDLHTLQDRELERCDREEGITTALLNEISKLPKSKYDLIVDTTLSSPQKIAEDILSFIEQEQPKAFGYLFDELVV